MIIKLMEPADKSRRVPWKPILLSACIAAVALYWMFLWPDVAKDAKPPIALMAGWDELGACSTMASLDGSREIKLSENQNAEMWDHSSLKEGESDIVQGMWRYDASSKRYAVTLNGETTTYTLVERDEPVTCVCTRAILGRLTSAPVGSPFPAIDDTPD
jgi:hypothetical protein